MAFPQEEKLTCHVYTWLLGVGIFPLLESSYWVSLRVCFFWTYIFLEVIFHTFLIFSSNLMRLILFSYTMARKTTIIHVRDIISLYSTADMINKSRHDISFSSIGRERDVLIEHYLCGKRANMDNSEDPFVLYFYFHLPIICDLGVLDPFTSFEHNF